MKPDRSRLALRRLLWAGLVIGSIAGIGLLLLDMLRANGTTASAARWALIPSALIKGAALSENSREQSVALPVPAQSALARANCASCAIAR